MVSYFLLREMTSANERKGWPRATPVTRANHGIDNDRMEAHANLAGMGDFNCRVEIDLSPRGGLSCARTTFHSFFFYLIIRPFPSALFGAQNVSAFSRYGNTYPYYATSFLKSNMKSSAWAKFFDTLLCLRKILFFFKFYFYLEYCSRFLFDRF